MGSDGRCEMGSSTMREKGYGKTGGNNQDGVLIYLIFLTSGVP